MSRNDSRQSEGAVSRRARYQGLLRLVAELVALFKIGLCLSIFALFTIYGSAVIVRSGIARVQQDCFVEIADRVVVLLFVIVGYAAVIVCIGSNGI